MVEVEKLVEVPMWNDRIVEVEKLVERPIEVVKIEQIFTEVEKIVYEKVFVDNGQGHGPGEADDCDCLTGARFLTVWNKIFSLQGVGSTSCLTEEQFINLINGGIRKNVSALMASLDQTSTTVDASIISAK